MLLPEGIPIYLIMIMASLEWAGKRMLAEYATHVVLNKIITPESGFKKQEWRHF